VHIAKINIFFDILYYRDNSNNLVVIIRVKELYFSSVLSIRTNIFRSSCKIKRINGINKINKIKYYKNCINKILQNILLLLKKN